MCGICRQTAVLKGRRADSRIWNGMTYMVYFGILVWHAVFVQHLSGYKAFHESGETTGIQEVYGD